MPSTVAGTARRGIILMKGRVADTGTGPHQIWFDHDRRNRLHSTRIEGYRRAGQAPNDSSPSITHHAPTRPFEAVLNASCPLRKHCVSLLETLRPGMTLGSIHTWHLEGAKLGRLPLVNRPALSSQ